MVESILLDRILLIFLYFFYEAQLKKSETLSRENKYIFFLGKNKFILSCLFIQIGWRDEFIR